MQIVIKVVSGRFGDAEYAEMSRVLTWIRPGQRLVAGRSRSADFVVASDEKMSGRHFEIACLEDRCLLRDLGSSNGTFVDDQSIIETELTNGDLIRAGDTQFHVRITGQGPTKPQSAEVHFEAPIDERESDSVIVTPAFTDLLKGEDREIEAIPDPVNMDQPDVSSSMQVVLKILGGPFGESEFADVSRILNWIGPGQTLKVGRHAYEADMAIPNDERMSSLHFEVSCDGHAAAVRDLNSTNGTSLNGQRIGFAKLNDNDEIAAGETRFGVRIIGVAASAQADAPLPVDAPTVGPAELAPPADEGKTDEGKVDEQGEPADSQRTAQPEAGASLSPTMTVVLKIKSGPHGDLSLEELTRLLVWIRADQTIKVGSSSIDADLSIRNDVKLAAVHFAVSCDGRSCRLRGLETGSGTQVNGQIAAEALLRDGDEIKAGNTVFEVRIIGAPDFTEEQQAAALVVPDRYAPPAIAPTPEVLNTTPFTFATFTGRIGYPGHSLTLVVKGVFDLQLDRPAVPAEEQRFPTGDLFYPDDDEHQGSVRYESDFAFVKPQTDLLLVGTCHPSTAPVSQCDVTFQIGSTSKTLTVFGDRYWQGEGAQRKASDPGSFSHMPLRYEHSFGGEASKSNPCGKGAGVRAANDQRRPLPNIEDPNDLVTTPDDHHEPAGFGPVSREWSRRQGELGTYDEAWLKTRWPWFPEDFQWTYYNSAPPDLRPDIYLGGDEQVMLGNLHPKHREFRSELPGLRLRCFLIEVDPASPGGDDGFREVKMNIDTLWIDAEAEQLVLVWRGVADVASAGCPNLKQVFVAAERMELPAASLDECRAAFEGLLAQRDAESNPKPEQPTGADDSDTDESTDTVPENKEDEYDKQAREAAEKSAADLRRILLNAGIDPDNLPVHTEEDVKKAEAALREQGYEIPEEDEDENVDADDDVEPSWTRERVIEHLKIDRALVGVDLRRLDLSELDFSGVDLSRSNLDDTKLVSAQFQEANLERAILSRADLTNAVLSSATLVETDFNGATCDGADLSMATASNANFFKCSMRNAQLRGIDAADAVFEEADLGGAILDTAVLIGADFSKSQLQDSSFQEADLTAATFSGAQATRINMSSSNLTKLRAADGCEFREGMFHNAIGPDSSWAGGDLTAADFSSVEMESADFTGACLRGANLHAANMKFARLAHADLTEALLTRMNLFEGSLDSADLTSANLSGSNMYCVEFVNAVLDHTRMKDTNLKMTKLREFQS